MNSHSLNQLPLSAPGANIVWPELSELIMLNRDQPPTDWDRIVERLQHGSAQQHLYLGRNADTGSPWLLHRPLLRLHSHILGGTGTGKTGLAVAPLTTQLMGFGDSSIVILDFKGDHALFYNAAIEAARAGLPFRWVTFRPGAASHVYNHFQQSHRQQQTLNARAQTHLTSLGLYYGNGYGKGHFSTNHLNTTHAMFGHYGSRIRSFADFAKYLEDPAAHRAVGSNLEDNQHLRSVVKQLAGVESINIHAASRQATPAVLANSIDMTDVLTRKQVVYFFLPACEEEVMAGAIGKLAMYDLLSAANVLGRNPRHPRVPCYVFLDEFQVVCGENITRILEMARSFGVHCVLSHHTIDQLKTVDWDITGVVESCTNLKMIFEASSRNAMKHLIDTSGEVREYSLSWKQSGPMDSDQDSEDDWVHPTQAASDNIFEPPLINASEAIRPRCGPDEIFARSADPNQCFVRSRQDEGWTQYRGQLTPLECQYHIAKEEFEARNLTMLPSEHPTCITAGLTSEGAHTPAQTVSSAPLHAAPPPQSAQADLDQLLNRAGNDLHQRRKRPRRTD